MLAGDSGDVLYLSLCCARFGVLSWVGSSLPTLCSRGWLASTLNAERCFLTTLGKAAVPPNVLTACFNSGQSRQAAGSMPVEASSGLLGNARGLLSAEGFNPLHHLQRNRGSHHLTLHRLH